MVEGSGLRFEGTLNVVQIGDEKIVCSVSRWFKVQSLGLRVSGYREQGLGIKV